MELSATGGTPDRPIWQGWLLANSIGGTLGVLGGVLAAFVSAGMGFGLVIGLGLGLAQRRMLQHLLPRDCHAPLLKPLRWWVAINVLGAILPGWLIVFAVILGASNGGNSVTDQGAYVGGVLSTAALVGSLAGGIAGSMVGALHGLLFQRMVPTGTRRVFAWSLASGLGWAASWALTGAGLGGLMTAGAVSGILQLALLVAGGSVLLGSWSVYGLSTGRLLSRA